MKAGIFMLAVRYHGIGDVRVEEVPRPVCGRGEVLVKVVYAGICGSDLHIYRKGMFVVNIPEIMGHEFVGVVSEVGADVTGFAPGETVVGDPRVTCGSCTFCRQGKGNLCSKLGFIGEVAPGCFAEYLVLAPELLLKIPPGVTHLQAALVEPFAVALRIVDKARLTPHTRLGIIGAGPIGLLTLLAARSAGVEQVAVVDISPARRSLASKLGADLVLESITGAQQGQVDIVVEAVGSEKTLQSSIEWVKTTGRIVLSGLYEDKVNLVPNGIVEREIEVVGASCYDLADLKRSIDCIAAGKFDVTSIVSHILPLTAAPEAFKMLTETYKNASKILLQPD